MKWISSTGTYIPSLLGPFLPPSHPPRSSQCPKPSSLCCLAASHKLSIYTWDCIYISPILLIHPTLPVLPWEVKHLLTSHTFIPMLISVFVSWKKPCPLCILTGLQCISYSFPLQLLHAVRWAVRLSSHRVLRPDTGGAFLTSFSWALEFVPAG